MDAVRATTDSVESKLKFSFSVTRQSKVELEEPNTPKIDRSAKKPHKYRKKKQSKATKKELTENQHCIRKRAEDWQKEAANYTRPENLQQQLATTGQIRSSREHEVAINKYQEHVPQSSLGARQESVRLLTRFLRRRERIEKQIRRVPRTLQAIGNQIRRRSEVTTVCGGAEDEEQEAEVGEDRFSHFVVWGRSNQREYVSEDMSMCVYITRHCYPSPSINALKICESGMSGNCVNDDRETDERL
ncbi:hypothetical protein HS088_TW21G00414 [Tripterygium wilfordii]|uniref:Uncharacterized protein n=1 Tax=Tripterygium wilfordii TaxID=458696 RepID=A0A7J7C277_TRIWF|nr:hypothetical protein HS088_TW21G00414 [Tripterygium wilfordii]